MSTPISYFPEATPGSQHLLEDAVKLVKPNRLFDSFHILCAAFGQGGFVARNAILDENSRAMLQSYFNFWIENGSNFTSFGGDVSDRLKRCAAKYTELKSEQNWIGNEALVIYAALASDTENISSPAFSNIPYLSDSPFSKDKFMEMLAKLFEPRNSYSTDKSSFRSNISYLPNIPIEQQFPPLPATSDLFFASLFPVIINQIKATFRRLDQNHIAILVGKNGSPLSYVPSALADYIAQGGEIKAKDRIDPVKKVIKINVPGLVKSHMIPDRPAPISLLSAVIDYSIRESALLVLDGIEVLQEIGEIQGQLRAMLDQPRGAFILGLKTEIASQNRYQQNLDINNVVLVPVPESSKEQTKELIYIHYVPKWEQEFKYSFEKDAFDWVIDLEPGCWINEIRKYLPYLAIDIGEEAIIDAMSNQFPNMATEVLNILEKLRKTEPPKPNQEHKKYEDILSKLEVSIKDYLKNPIFAQRNELTVLTRTIVTVELVYHNNSEFHYPGYSPDNFTLS